ncbi:arginyl-tRNA synthetase [Cladophialophora psammophila CBS 110553]|uniref:arginine--tRNA ligase n=1 Tax=Cladophialophora psammophila CBS 110553 TaxID=1182543 RepID=W9WVD2_9EURO|nr:arginyl-tRNA synthetase [Cladophialophora psammophila CBS 110553]EXJ68616.1 arginyl-tRNA synthetase [Cladophialophora psammophila CBS 110553]
MATTSVEGLCGFLQAMGIENTSFVSTSTDLYTNPLAIYFSHLAELIVQLTDCEQQVAYKSIFPKSPLFGHPVNDGINLLFYFSNSNLARLLMSYVIDRGASYGNNLLTEALVENGVDTKGQKVIVEFSSPNLGKAFTGLHLRSTIIGAFIASVYERLGWNVTRMTFLGDWGKHIGLLAAGWSRFGSDELFDADPLRHLLDVYAQIEELFKKEQEAAKKVHEGEDDAEVSHEIEAERDDFFKKLEDGDPDALTLWKRFREVCIERYTELYARLGVRFDDYSGESDVSHEAIEEVENALKENGVYRESDGAWVIDISKTDEKHGAAIARFRNGTTTYLLRDIATVVERSKKYSFDKMIYVVSARQTTHFQQVFKALDLMGRSDLAQRLEHIGFGDVHGLLPKEGASGLLLSDILDQCRDATKLALDADGDTLQLFSEEDPERVLNALGAINLMADDLSTRRGGTFNFDLNKLANPGDYTGLNLQKWYTGLSSKLSGVEIDRAELESTDYSMFEGEDNAYADILRLLVQFPGIVKTSFEKLESSHILTFLFNLVDLLPNVWEDEAEAEGSSRSLAKLAFYKCFHVVLENGMRTLGLAPLTA